MRLRRLFLFALFCFVFFFVEKKLEMGVAHGHFWLDDENTSMQCIGWQLRTCTIQTQQYQLITADESALAGIGSGFAATKYFKDTRTRTLLLRKRLVN